MRILLFLLALFFATSASAEDEKLKMQRLLNEAKRKVHSMGPGFELIGTLEKGSLTQYAINGEDIVISDATQIEGKIKLGATADAIGRIEGGKKLADTLVVTGSATPPKGADTDDAAPDPAASTIDKLKLR